MIILKPLSVSKIIIKTQLLLLLEIFHKTLMYYMGIKYSFKEFYSQNFHRNFPFAWLIYHGFGQVIKKRKWTNQSLIVW